MNNLEEVYFEFGKLNILIKNAKKNYLLLPMIVRQGVQSLNCNKNRIKFETLFAPNVADNATKEVMLVVKLIKTINDVSAEDDFDISSIKQIVLAFKKDANVSVLDDIKFDFSISCLFEIYKKIYVENNEIWNLVICAIFNVFFVKAKLINFPMLDVSNALLQFSIVKDEESFLNLILFAVESSENIIEKHKKLIKQNFDKSNEVGMKSVSVEYNYLIENPVVEIGSMLDDLQMTFATLSKATSILENLGILTKIAGSQRYRVFKYDELCKLFEN
ncbi:MAG: hypothetical protein ACI4TX_01770 [Christensenellales bacterium]